jgi:hypothetical protein
MNMEILLSKIEAFNILSLQALTSLQSRIIDTNLLTHLEEQLDNVTDNLGWCAQYLENHAETANQGE